MVAVGRVHAQRSLEERGHVVCREYREDWKRVGEGPVALMPCDGSLFVLLTGNFPLFFFFSFPPRKKSHKRRSVADFHRGQRDSLHAGHAIHVTHALYRRWVIFTAAWSSGGKKNESSPHVPAKRGGITMEKTGVNVSFLDMISLPRADDLRRHSRFPLNCRITFTSFLLFYS